MTGPETRLQRKIQDAITDEWPDAWVLKVHGGPFQASGIPDLLACVEGRFIALEVKHPDQPHPVSDLQQAHLDWIGRAGGVAAVVESVEEALDAINRSLSTNLHRDG